jgi:formylglycine-generating enzyme required for sulfatase activity
MGLDDLTPDERDACRRAFDDFEADYRAGRRPRIGELLERVPERARPLLIDRLRSELPAASDLLEASTTLLPPDVGAPLRTPRSHETHADDAPPQRIGRFSVVRLLGSGGFGRVYLARDAELDRDVALKVPRSGSSAEQLDEARKVARLRHPGIVSVYDVGHDETGVPFLVLEYVAGQTLEDRLHAGPLEPARLAAIVARVARAVHHAHTAGLVHRDLKPTNILLDAQGEPRVTDFGLALVCDPLTAPRGEVAGTYAYMAPEQVRGESHRLDGRTDVWALGVILYRGLTGKLPFPGRDAAEISDEILHREPHPPRQLDDRLPRQLERVCLKCLARRMKDRYQTAADLAEDLEHALDATPTRENLPAAAAAGPGGRALPASPVPPSTEVGSGVDPVPRLVPRGLAAFDNTDAATFLSLMPGPRDRRGLPESLRFWQSWVEGAGNDPDRTLPVGAENAAAVGLLYGPSGGGKSSFVRAGLLPRLAPSVRAVYIETAAVGTESRLLAELVRLAGEMPDDATMPEVAAAIRQGRGLRPGGKLLIVLDQFEQWLQAHPAGSASALTHALRQCDGTRVQALCLVRDDFWMAVTRFFQALEVPLLEGVNSAAVELPHGAQVRIVLQAYGRACDRFSGPGGAPSPDEARFIDAAAAGLAGPDGSVIPARLSLFAEVVRRRAWIPKTLDDLGGVEGIGVRFLEESFDAPTAPPAHKAHRKAAQAVLQALLPPPPSSIRSAARSDAELRTASGYGERAADFAALLRVLDAGLRLITPVDPADDNGYADEPRTSGEDRSGPSYQLAHDYLVSPVRQWLEKKQQETRSGRARRLLASTAALWAERPGPRRLPSVFEWVGILGLTRRRSWTPVELRMMRAAAWHYLVRVVVVACAAAVLGVLAVSARERIAAEERFNLVRTAQLATLAELFPKLDPFQKRITPRLVAIEASPDTDPLQRAVATALLYRYEPTERRALAIRTRLLKADPDELALERTVLAAHPDRAGIDPLWGVAGNPEVHPAERLRAAAALAGLDLDGPRWRAVAPAVVAALRAEDRAVIHRWAGLLDPARRMVVPALEAALIDPGADSTLRAAAAVALTEIHGTLHPDAPALARLLPEVPADVFPPMIRAVERMGGNDAAAGTLDRMLVALMSTPAADDTARDQATRREARTALALAAIGYPDRVWPRLVHRDDPRVRSALIDQYGRLGLGAEVLLERLPHAADVGERQALLLALGELVFNSSAWSGRDRQAAVLAARGLLAADPDPGVHSAAELLLRRLGHADAVADVLRAAAPALAPAPGRRWFSGANGHVFAVTVPLEGWVGTPAGERNRNVVETLHYVRTGRSLAVATTETTVGQYREFLKGNPDLRVPIYAKPGGRDAETAMGQTDWYEAARYCNWLSKAAGIPPAEWCYPEPVGPGVTLDENAVDRAGFRLPTEAEWELFCRCGTTTVRPFESSGELLPRYAWCWLTSDDLTQPVARLWPNPVGLFDIIGNQWEWCHDGRAEPGRGRSTYPPGTPEQPAADRPPAQTILGQRDQLRPGLESERAQRGGAFDYAPGWCRAGGRGVARVFVDDRYCGFRVVRTMGKP